MQFHDTKEGIKTIAENEELLVCFLEPNWLKFVLKAEAAATTELASTLAYELSRKSHEILPTAFFHKRKGITVRVWGFLNLVHGQGFGF